MTPDRGHDPLTGRSVADGALAAGRMGDGTIREGLGTGEPDAVIVLSEERLNVDLQDERRGSVSAVKHIEHRQVEEQVSRGVEQADMERVAVQEGDSGQIETMPDGSVSIPVFEEEIVVTKRLVVRERVVLRKHTVYEEQTVTADLRREHLTIETDGDVRVSGDVDEPAETLRS